jgi:hypothetical protein
MWLETTLTVSSKMKRDYKNIVKAPKLWLLVGYFYIEDARMVKIHSKSTSNDASLNVPVAEPTGIAALLGAKVGSRMGFQNGFQAEVSSEKVKGKMVWAAKWQLVHAKYVHVDDWDATSLKKRIQLLDGYEDYSLGTVRGGNGDHENAVEFNFSKDGEEEGAVPSEGTAPEEYNEAKWQIFDKEFDALIEKLS